MSAPRRCDRCLGGFYRPEADALRERLRDDAPPIRKSIALEQAGAYCDDCLVALFPRVFNFTAAADAEARKDGSQTGGGRWVNPNRGRGMA